MKNTQIYKHNELEKLALNLTLKDKDKFSFLRRYIFRKPQMRKWQNNYKTKMHQLKRNRITELKIMSFRLIIFRV